MTSELSEKISLKDLFAFRKRDLVYMWTNVISMLVVYAWVWKSGSLDALLLYRGSASYIQVAKSLYSDRDRIFAQDNGNSLVQVLIGYPILLKAVSFVFFGCWKLAIVVLCMLLSILSTILFNRLLIVWNVASDPRITTLMFCVFPPHALLYRCVASPEMIYISCVFLSLIFYKHSKIRELRMILFVTALFSEKSVILMLSFFFVFFMFGRYKFAFGNMLACAHGLLVSFIFQFISKRSFFGFFKAFYIESGNFSAFPLFSLFSNAMSISTMRSFHGVYGVLIPILLGTVSMKSNSMIFYSFIVTSTVYYLWRQSGDTIKDIIPVLVISVCIGFDKMFHTPKFEKIVKIAMTALFAMSVVVSSRCIITDGAMSINRQRYLAQF